MLITMLFSVYDNIKMKLNTAIIREIREIPTINALHYELSAMMVTSVGIIYYLYLDF